MNQLTRVQRLFALALAIGMVAACGGGSDAPAPTPSPSPSPTPVPSPPPSPTPPPPSGTATRIEKTMTVDGRTRRYLINLPPGHMSNGTVTVPLVIAMHGGGGWSEQFETSSRLTPKANAANVAVVYPNGIEGALGIQTWNGGGCCGGAVTQNVDDVKFLIAVVDDLVANHRIDTKRVYATGHSNGGIMAYRLACERADRIAAIAPNAGVEMAPACNLSRPVPLLHMHSKLDFNVPVAGGVGVGVSGVNFPALRPTIDAWAVRNGCLASAGHPVVTPISNAYTQTRWSTCLNGSEVDFLLTDDGGHAWPGGLPVTTSGDVPSVAIDANDRLLSFFARFALP